MAHPADEFIGVARGPVATVRYCKICNFMHKVPKGGAGRGYGLRTGSKSRGILIQHIKAEHPEVLEH